MRRTLLQALGLMVVVAATTAGVMWWVSRPPPLEQGTPEATLATARLLVERGQARHLARLVYAEDPQMGVFLDKLGVLMGNMQRLGEAIAKQYPKELAALKEEENLSKARRQASGLVGNIVGQQRRRRGEWDPKEDESRRRAFEDTVRLVFADPYAWLRDGEGRLSAEYLTDDIVALRWDGEPILPPIGLQMKRGEDGKWYFALPLKLPVVQKYVPRSNEEWQIWGSMLGVLDRLVVDLRLGVEGGKIQNLDELSRVAGEKAFLPAAMVALAYDRALAARKKGEGGK